MSTRFEDLFPGQSKPFEPIEIGRAAPQLESIQTRARQAIDLGGGGSDDAFDAAFGDLLTKAPSAAAPEQETSWSDYPKALTSGLAQTGSMLAGAGRSMAERFVGEGNTPGQQTALDLSRSLGQAETALTQYGQSWINRTSPAFQERLAREWATLDPTKSIWRGGPGETLGAIAAQATAALPPTLAPLISGGLLMRAGAPVMGRIVLGASEATLSMGATSQAIRQELAQVPDDVLQQESQRYAQLRAQMDEGAAREIFNREVDGWTPQLVGALVGTIGAVTGRYLEPVFLPDQGLPVAQRFARGAVFEGLAQEAPQNVAQQVAQNYAAQTFDRGRSLMQGVPEQALQGAGLGGIMGGGAAVALGRGPQPSAAPTEPSPEAVPPPSITPESPVDPDIVAALRMAAANDRVMAGQEAAAPPTQFDPYSGQGELLGRPPTEDVLPPASPSRTALPTDRVGTDMGEVWARNEALDLQGGQNPVPPSTSRDFTMVQGAPTQQPLGLRAAERGRPVIEPTPAQPLVTDTSAPPGFDLSQPMEQPRVTRADMLRQRQSVGAPMDLREGMVRDPRQQDMFGPAIESGSLSDRYQPHLDPSIHTPDEPSAEPLADIRAQLEDLADPDSPRLGVYLSRDNLANLDAVPTVGVPLADFDGKGGLLIAKDRQIAEQLLDLRDEGADMQQVLGLATGAGTGKPAGADITVQQRDEQGNVTRESLVATPEEADALAAEWEEPGRDTAIISAGQAIKRRTTRIRQEQRTRLAGKEASAARDTARTVIDEEIDDPAARRLAHAVVDRADDETTEEIIANRLINLATQVRGAVGEQRPGQLQLLAAARRISPDEFRKRSRAVQPEETDQPINQMPRQRHILTQGAQDIPDSVPERRERLRTISEQELTSAPDTDVEELFTEAAIVGSGRQSRVRRPERGINELLAEGKEALEGATIEEAAGRSYKEIVEAYPSPSEKRKYIGRVQRLLQRREYGGGVKTPPITAKAVERKIVGTKTPVRTEKFEPGTIFKSPPRELSEADAKKHRQRAVKAQEQLAKVTGKLTKLAERLDAATIAEAGERDADGRMTEEAREAVYGRAYLKTLVDYGQLLGRANNLSRQGLREVEKFTARVQKLLELTPDNLMSRLSLYMRAESREQAMRTARSDTTVLGKLRTDVGRNDTLRESNTNLRERIARAKRLHDVWAKDEKFNQFVAPLLQKLVGYMTYDTGVVPIASERRGLGYLPTFNEMRQLRAAMQSFKQTSREELYKPLKRWLRELGFKFDETGDLVLAKNAAEYDKIKPTHDLTGRRTAFQNTPLNANQKRAAWQAKRYKEMLDKERARRAKLSPSKRRREDVSLLSRLEQERRERETANMSYEQRKAWESMERRGLPLELDSFYTMVLPQIRPAVQRITTALEADDPPRLDSVLKTLATTLPPDHPYQPLLQRMIDLNMVDVDVNWGDLRGGSAGKFYESTRTITLNRATFETMRAEGRDPSPALLHTLLHEAVHAATAGAIRNRPMVARAFKMLIAQMREAAAQQGVSLKLGTNEFYGIRGNDPFEFVAEAFTNDLFQDVLKQIKVDGRTIWQKLIDAIRLALGLADTPKINNMLDLVLSTADAVFTGEHSMPTSGVQVAYAMKDDGVRQVVSNLYDKAIQSSRVTKDLETRARETVANNREGANRFLLSALTMEQLSDFYRRAFNGQLEKYTKAFFARNADNSKNMEPADQLSRKWTKLEEEQGEESAYQFSRLMTQATLYGIHPDLPLSHKDNAHASQQVAKHAELAAMWRALKPGYRELYRELVDYYEKTLRTEVNLVTLNALRTMLEGDFKYTEADVSRLKLNTIDGLKAEFGSRLEDSQIDTLMRIARIPEMHQGPYFPLMRSGDYVVRAERLVLKKTFPNRKEGIAWAREQQAADPTLSVSWRETDDGREYSVYEREVRLAESTTQADADYKELVKTYGEGNVRTPVLKADLFSSGAAIETGAGLNTVLNKLKGNPAAQAAIKDFYLRSLSDRAFRKREIRRTNRKGVDESRQHRSFRNYGRSAAYYTSQLRFGWQMGEALGDMKNFIDDVSKGEAQSSMSPVRLGEVLREIDNRDKMTTTREEATKWVRRGTTLSQFMMLTSPSYWMLNATQPYMVTLPWLASRSSLSEASAALATAQGLILDPLAKQAGKSWLGAKSLWSPSSTDEAFSVLEQVETHIRKRGGARADDYIKMLDQLKRASIIDFSRESELRDMVSTPTSDLTQRVLDSSRIMSHLTEVNNRIMTALAAYDLYRNKGMSHEEATGFAQQAVSLTQFNYSPGNSPRLFQARGPLGPMGPLVFQFMKYPQHIYALMARNYREAFRGADPHVRKQGRDALLGLFLTHVAAGGLVGAMIQPAKWAIGLAMMAFGDDDEPYTLGNAISGDTYNRLTRKLTNELFGTEVGEILASGLPRAVGMDISNRVELGTLYMVDLDPKTSETLIGSAVETFGGPTVNLFANWYRGYQYAQEGQLTKAAETALPKFGRDILRAIRFSNEGLSDGTGKEIIGADKMTPWDLFVQSIGVQPARTSEKYAERNAITAQQTYDEERRSKLMQRFNNADPMEREELLREITEFSRRNPAAAITRSQLLRSAQQWRQSEQRMGLYGANLRGRDVLYADEGEDYAAD